MITVYIIKRILTPILGWKDKRDKSQIQWYTN